jgi:hypothetical protein|tara:strand:- start:4233 stop:4481 length:249 start_codon:yes stop_codon:yes gene_type:complete
MKTPKKVPAKKKPAVKKKIVDPAAKHLSRRWGSLTDLKSYLETKTKEKVISFNGFVLTTNKGSYSISVTYGTMENELVFKKK